MTKLLCISKKTCNLLVYFGFLYYDMDRDNELVYVWNLNSKEGIILWHT